MRLKSTEKLSHENVYKCYDDKTSTDPEDFIFTGGRGGGKGGTCTRSTSREQKRLLICLFCGLKYERPVTTSTLCGIRKNHTPGRLTSL